MIRANVHKFCKSFLFCRRLCQICMFQASDSVGDQKMLAEEQANIKYEVVAT